MARIGSVVIALFCVLHLGSNSLVAEELEGAGVGVKALLPLWKSKSPENAAALAMKEIDADLAASAFAMYLRLEKDPASSKAIANITRFGKRSGMRDRAAFVLAFLAQMRGAGRAPVIEALTKSQDAGAQELAAATLATLYCHAYVSSPETFLSARNDQKSGGGAAAKRTVAKGKPRSGKGRATGALPAITDELFASRDGYTAVLAAVAAAFSGDARYKELITAIPAQAGTLAGAVLLYEARQDAELTDERVTKLFRAALGKSGGTSRSAPNPLFSPLLPGGCLACMGVAELGEERHLPLLLLALQSEDYRVQVDAVRAIRRIGPDDTILAAMSKVLMQAKWPVVVELCAALGAAPDKRVMPSLIMRLDKEHGRIRLDLVHALSAIAGEQKGRTAAEWKAWWQKAGKDFEVDPAASQAYRKATPMQKVDIPSLGFFYGLPIYSDRLVYVVDTSKSMRGARIASLRENLDSSLYSLEQASRDPKRKGGFVQFNIVDYGGDVVTMYGGALTSNFELGKKRTATMPLTYGTRSYDATERALRLPRMDTIYFLSDGAPIIGQFQAWPSMIATMDLLMLHYPVAIWSVAFDPKGGNGEAMTRMSGDNFGSYEAPPL